MFKNIANVARTSLRRPPATFEMFSNVAGPAHEKKSHSTFRVSAGRRPKMVSFQRIPPAHMRPSIYNPPKIKVLRQRGFLYFFRKINI
jgi:hypothetical protein